MAKNEWLIQLAASQTDFESLGANFVYDFAYDMAKLHLEESDIHGHVLVIGSGSILVERALLCDAPTFNTLRPNIASLVTIDTHYPRYSNRMLQQPVDEDADADTMQQPGHITHCYASSDDFFRVFPTSCFDTILMFRIAGMGNQFRDGLVRDIAPHLTPGGLFIGTGSFSGVDSNLLHNTPLTLKTATLLSNPSGGFPFYKEHVGFVLQKEE